MAAPLLLQGTLMEGGMARGFEVRVNGVLISSKVVLRKPRGLKFIVAVVGCSSI